MRATPDAAQAEGGDQGNPYCADVQQKREMIERLAREAKEQYHLKALIVQVRCNGRDVRTMALGESMYGVPATPQMHFRNGAMAFTYMSTMLLELVDEHQVSLDDKLSNWFPELPNAGRITLRSLANMTNGYADYVYTPTLLNGTVLDPFRQWRPEELIHAGVSRQEMFEPLTNWGYCHTGYVILGEVLEQITHMSLADAMKKYIIDRMDLEQTRSFSTPQIPEPVLHVYSSERREILQIPARLPFYEESTFWNPSWTTVQGAIQTTDITDMSRSMEIVGEGRLLSKASFKAQVGPNLVGFGHKQKGCSACRANTEAFNYGLGVINLGPWNVQVKDFAGSGGTVGYLRSRKLTISIATTYKPDAFNAEGVYKESSAPIFTKFANALAPNTLPPQGGAAQQ